VIYLFRKSTNLGHFRQNHFLVRIHQSKKNLLSEEMKNFLPMAPTAMGVWQGVAMDALQFHLGPPCPTPLPPLKSLHGRFRGGLPAEQASCGRLLPFWTPHAVRVCRQRCQRPAKIQRNSKHNEIQIGKRVKLHLGVTLLSIMTHYSWCFAPVQGSFSFPLVSIFGCDSVATK
jgi:hypothetical protein